MTVPHKAFKFHNSATLKYYLISVPRDIPSTKRIAVPFERHVWFRNDSMMSEGTVLYHFNPLLKVLSTKIYIKNQSCTTVVAAHQN